MDKKYTEDEARVSACNILPFYTLKSLHLINTKHTQYYYSISAKSSLINSNNNEIMMIMMIIVIIIVVELLIVILKIIMIMLLQCCILLINREWSHYREISDCGLDVLLGQYIKGEV